MSDLSSYEQRVTVQPEHIDELGHVNNVVYLQFMEGVARAHAAAVGMDLATLSALQCVPVARQHTLKYHRPAFHGDELRIRTRIVRAHGVRAYRQYEVRRAVSDELLAEGETEWVWLDPQKGRPRGAMPEILAAFGLEQSA